MASRSRGRPAKGSPMWHKGAWHVRVTLPTGERPIYPLDIPGAPPIPQHDIVTARAQATVISELARSSGLVPKMTPETVSEYSVRWLAERSTRGMNVGHESARLRDYALGEIGTSAMTEISKAVLERLVQRMDERVRAGGASWLTVRHAWVLVATMFRDAASSKNLSLRVRSENPCSGVRPPDKGRAKQMQFLWPDEFDALMRCSEVPLKWRRLFAIAAYTGLRAGEIAALEVSDVHLAQRYISVRQSLDRSTGEIKSPKTATSTRRLPIDPNLMPLVQAMLAHNPDRRYFIKIPSPSTMAICLRKYLKRAGVKRPELFETTERSKGLRFHDVRASTLTWWAVQGLSPITIMRRAGHSTFSTTNSYVRIAEDLRDSFRDVFPPLPTELYSDIVTSRVLPMTNSDIAIANDVARIEHTQPPSGLRELDGEYIDEPELFESRATDYRHVQDNPTQPSPNVLLDELRAMVLAGDEATLMALAELLAAKKETPRGT